MVEQSSSSPSEVISEAATVAFDCADRTHGSQIVLTVPSGLVSLCEISVGVALPDMSGPQTWLTPRPLRQVENMPDAQQGLTWRRPRGIADAANCARYFNFAERLEIAEISFAEPPRISAFSDT